MKTLSVVLPGIALGAVALLVTPGPTVDAFSARGESLALGQRDFRLYNNFVDPTANDNVATKLMFPGYLGAEQAIWKGTIEWNSMRHGTGLGDPLQNVGDGGADFDAAWAGNATSIGGTNDNVISTITSCGSGVLAFTELATANGWRIRFCEDHNWNDGPGNIGGTWDIQGVQTHEYGHALGLNHTTVGAATMAPSGSIGSTSERSIHPDDQAGIQFIYGVRSASKPVVCETAVSGASVTITGYNFDPVDNDVWFTQGSPTAGGLADPRVRIIGVPSTNGGRTITVAIPAAAGDGDVLVKTSAAGGASLSNAFPINVTGATTLTASNLCAVTAAAITPSTIEALDPGTTQSVTISGDGLNDVTSIEWNTVPIATSRWTIIDANSITIDMPQGGVLGSGNTLELTDGTTTDTIAFTVVEPASPKLELGNGEDFNATANGAPLNVIVSGIVGTTHQIWFSKSPIPSNHPQANWLLGNNFTEFRFALARVIGPNGYTQIAPTASFTGASPTDFYCQSIDITTSPSPEYGISNLQIITLTP